MESIEVFKPTRGPLGIIGPALGAHGRSLGLPRRCVEGGGTAIAPVTLAGKQYYLKYQYKDKNHTANVQEHASGEFHDVRPPIFFLQLKRSR